MNRGNVYEIVGVAGSGKTTLLKHLIDNYDGLEKKPVTKKVEYLHLWLMSIFDIAKCYFSDLFVLRKKTAPAIECFLSNDERYRYFEVKLLLQLCVLTRIIEKRSRTAEISIVLDQGPIYMIAALYVVCNAKNKMYQHKLIMKCFDRYLSVLSGVLFLDTSFDCLQERWRKRADWKNYKDVFRTKQNIINHHNMFKKEYLELVGKLASQEVQVTTQNDPYFDLGITAKKLLQES